MPKRKDESRNTGWIKRERERAIVVNRERVNVVLEG